MSRRLMKTLSSIPEIRLSKLLLAAIALIAVCLHPMSVADETKLELVDSKKKHLVSLPAIETSRNIPLQLENSKITIVTFFASWCPPCLDEFQALNTVKTQLGDKITIVAVNAFEAFDSNDEARMQKFLEATDPSFPLVKGNDETLALFGNVNRIPTLYVFDRHGKQAFNFIHARGATKRSVDAEELTKALQPLL